MKRLSLPLLGACVLIAAADRVVADGFIVIDPPRPIHPVRPPHPPRPPARNVPLAVKNHQVTCDITDGVAVTRIDQTFHNPNRQPVEGTYIFPLDDDIAVNAFSMFMNGQEVKGRILDRDEARRTYESIVAKMRDPAILEYVGTRMYQARIFPIPAAGDVRVKLEYSQVLQAEGGMVRYRYPLSTEKYSSAPLEQVSFAAKIESRTPIKSVFCPTHSLSVHRSSEHRASASYEDRNVKPDRDLVLYYTLSEKDFGLALLTYREFGQDGFFLARIAPKAIVDPSDIVPKDICFVLDTSGSMAGDKIEQARKALRFCLSSLNRGDRFELVTFSHEPLSFSGGLQEATLENVGQARQFVAGIRAEGGTNINDALLKALQARAGGVEAGRPYLIVFLTDGQPTIGETEPAKILGNVKQANPAGVRLFVFGIGDDVNTHLLDKLAEQNHGARDYVGDREDLEIKLSTFYHKVADPVLANLQLVWHALEVYDIFPRQLPDLFSGGEVVVTGRYRTAGTKAVELLGDRRGTRERHVYEARFAEYDRQHEFLPHLWATRKIGFLLDEIRLHGESKELVDAVADLALKYGVVTPYTAYLVNEQQVEVARRGGRANVLARMVQEAEEAPARGGRGRVSLGARFRKGRGAGVSGAPAVADSRDAAALQEAKSLGAIGYDDYDVTLADDLAKHDATGSRVNPIRQVADRAFYNESNVWIDSKYREGDPTQKVKLYSDEYFALARKDRRAAQYLAQGPRVIFVLDGLAYETVSAD